MDFQNDQLIDGNRIADAIYKELKAQVSALKGRRPRVVFIRVGEDPASRFYVSKKQRIAQELGMESEVKVLPENTGEAEIIKVVQHYNQDAATDGILVQAPLPEGVSEPTVFNCIDPHKDVDGFNVINVGRLVQEDQEGFVACTPAGILEILDREHISTRGKHVVIIGRSLIVGKPLSLLLSRKHPQGDATVTLCHSRSEDLAALARTADILIAAVGRPGTVTADMVKPGAVVIDVGINRVEDASSPKGYRIAGDVDFENVAPVAGRITPVPGGVGPMTVAALMQNTLKAYLLRNHSKS